jgi:hypothetical protein
MDIVLESFIELLVIGSVIITLAVPLLRLFSEVQHMVKHSLLAEV